MLRDDTDPRQPQRIIFETPLGGNENKIISERITALRKKADELAQQQKRRTYV